MIKSLFDQEDEEPSGGETATAENKPDSQGDALESSSASGASVASGSKPIDKTAEADSAEKAAFADKKKADRPADILELPENSELERQIALIEAELEEVKAPVDNRKTTPLESVSSLNIEKDVAAKVPAEEKPVSGLDSTEDSKAKAVVSLEEYVPDSPAETLRKTGMAYSAAIALFGSVVFMLILGWFADLLLGIRPWGTVFGIVLGAAIGFLQFFRITSQIIKPKPTDFQRVSIMSQETDTTTVENGDSVPEAGGTASSDPAGAIANGKPEQNT